MTDVDSTASSAWLVRYYTIRGIVAAAWVVAAFALGRDHAGLAAAMLIAYPAWDALANLVDGRRSGGLRRNPTQAFNVIVSGATAIAVFVALGRSEASVYIVFGLWAGLAGLLQLATGVRRWKKAGAQWAMILSGAQSAFAATHFIGKALGNATSGITGIAPYAGFGAFYFLLSALLLTIASRRRARATAA